MNKKRLSNRTMSGPSHYRKRGRRNKIGGASHRAILPDGQREVKRGDVAVKFYERATQYFKTPEGVVYRQFARARSMR